MLSLSAASVFLMERKYKKSNPLGLLGVAFCDILSVRRSCLRSAVIPTIPLKGGGVMVTYSDLIQFTIMLITFAGLIIQIISKRK